MSYNYNKILISKHLGAKKNSKIFLAWTKYVMSGEVGASPPRRLAILKHTFSTNKQDWRLSHPTALRIDVLKYTYVRTRPSY